jgi:hypothetical protein
LCNWRDYAGSGTLSDPPQKNAEFGRSVARADTDANHLRKDFNGYFSDLSAIFSKDSDPSIRHWVEHQAMTADPTVAIALKLDTPNIDERQLFAHAGVPIRAINAQPPLSPHTNIDENKKYGNYDVILVSDAGHFVPMERPVEFNRDLSTWLQYLSSPGGASAQVPARDRSSEVFDQQFCEDADLSRGTASGWPDHIDSRFGDGKAAHDRNQCTGGQGYLSQEIR